MPRIAIDASWFGNTGIGRVADEILSRAPSGWEILEIRNGKKPASVLTPADLAFQIGRSTADLFWSPGFIPPLVKQRIPTIITIHDLTHLHHYTPYHRIYYNSIIKPLLKNITKIVTVSDYTKDELKAWLGTEAMSAVRIYNGVSTNFVPTGPRKDIGSKYVLYVGNRRDYKNLPRLFEAFSASRLSTKGFVLGLSGECDLYCAALEEKSGLTGTVHYFGFIPEHDLPSVYRGAQALAFPSLYEGFGLPILEAMACGVPVLTSNVTSMPEVAQGAAYLINPESAQSISAGLQRVCLDPILRATLIKKGRIICSKFSWEDSARQYWTVFEESL